MTKDDSTRPRQVEPLVLREAPALIETVFPAQKVSFEAQRERKAGAGQTLTSLGSYWKGRKPLILVRAILLGMLLPTTSDADADLAIFEKLMAFDDDGLARRALAASAFSPKEIAARITLDNPREYFNLKSKLDGQNTEPGGFPLDPDAVDMTIRWRREVTEEQRLDLYRRCLATFNSYEEKAGRCQRPEEVDQQWLYADVWPAVNKHYAHLGLQVTSFPELVEQFGIMRYGHRPQVGDTFCGGGSIPFEAARLGCDVYAADLNPVACMLTWGALNIIGASPERRAEIESAQRAVAAAVEAEITALGIEHDAAGNRAKAYLYCLETRCPETGWLVPMSPSWIISKTRNVVARLKPDYERKRFEIEVVAGVSAAEMATAAMGTIQDKDLVYKLDGRTYRTPIRTLRGDYRLADGTTGNRLRLWEKGDFKPRPDDIFQERLYAIQWIRKETLGAGRPETFFAAPNEEDLAREETVEQIVAANLARWQAAGLVPEMEIEPGDETTRLYRERGWTHWHHLFTPRQLVFLAVLKDLIAKSSADLPAALSIFLCRTLNLSAKLCMLNPAPGPGREPKVDHIFTNQAFNVFWNYGVRASWYSVTSGQLDISDNNRVTVNSLVSGSTADILNHPSDIFITDPPYADAVHYHEITEFFIAWLRKNPPAPFNEWTWDSRRALAIKGVGNDFRRGMVASYRAMAEHMPDNGMQCVMFTHQSTAVWSDLIGIFWAAGLQVVSAWYIATETTSELKQGGYVQGTVILILRKRAAGERNGFRQRLLPVVRQEVARQIETMLHLNDTTKDQHGEPVFNESDLQMAGYAAALKVLTACTHIGGEDVTTFALRPRQRGEVTVVDEIVDQAAETASNLLIPAGLASETWTLMTGLERFIFRMMEMERAGANKLDNYQNFAKAFRVEDYTRLMGDMRPNQARLKRVVEYGSRDLTESTELGRTRLGRLIMALQQVLNETDPQVIIEQLKLEMVDFLAIRPLLVEMLAYYENCSSEERVRTAAEVLGARLKNLRFGV